MHSRCHTVKQICCCCCSCSCSCFFFHQPFRSQLLRILHVIIIGVQHIFAMTMTLWKYEALGHAGRANDLVNDVRQLCGVNFDSKTASDSLINFILAGLLTRILSLALLTITVISYQVRMFSVRQPHIAHFSSFCVWRRRRRCFTLFSSSSMSPRSNTRERKTQQFFEASKINTFVRVAAAAVLNYCLCADCWYSCSLLTDVASLCVWCTTCFHWRAKRVPFPLLARFVCAIFTNRIFGFTTTTTVNGDDDVANKQHRQQKLPFAQRSISFPSTFLLKYHGKW